MGSRLKALTCYEESSQLLDRVTIYWSASNARRQATCCRGLQRWLEALSDCLTDTDALPPARDQTTVWVPVVLSESQSEYALAHLNVERYVVAGTINLAGHTFRLELLDSSHRPSLSAEADYYAIQIPKGAKDLLGAADQDYAMIVRQRRPDREGPGVLETGDSLAFGVFRRGRSGRIRFEPSDATILGGDAIEDRSAVGYVAGLLKRTES
jgi:hypothetical protein